MNWKVEALVKNPYSLVAYWCPPPGADLPPDACLRVVDLSGRPPEQSLDGTGLRLIPLVPGQRIHHVGSLLPDRLYQIQFGQLVSGAFTTVCAAAPVHTPWDHPAGVVAGTDCFIPGSRS